MVLWMRSTLSDGNWFEIYVDRDLLTPAEIDILIEYLGVYRKAAMDDDARRDAAGDHQDRADDARDAAGRDGP